MQFVKMEGIGNDFILMHGLTEDEFRAIPEETRFLCDRRKGIGADGVITVLPPVTAQADYRMRIFNADGSEAEMCGNGIRCFALYVNELGLSDKQRLAIETKAGLIVTERHGDMITVDMGRPILDGGKIPTAKSSGQVVMEPITVGENEFKVTAVSMGNPHAVIYTRQMSDDMVLGIGAKLESHPFFPQKTNVEFVRVLSAHEIEMRVFERGVGETMACGTGACAATVAGVVTGKHNNEVTVHLRGGDLSIAWRGNINDSVFMTGPANIVYRGKIEL